MPNKNSPYYIAESRYRSHYEGFDLIARPRLYSRVTHGDSPLRWEVYIAEKEGPYAYRADYPGEFLGSGLTLNEAWQAAHDTIDARWMREQGLVRS